MATSVNGRFTVLAHLHMQRDRTASSIEYREPHRDLPGRQVDIPKLRRGGVDCIWLSEGGPGEFLVDPTYALRAVEHPNTSMVRRTVYHGASGVQRILRGFDAVRRLCSESGELELVPTTEQARSAQALGKGAGFLHTENLLMAGDLAMLRAYYEVGLRITGLVHGVPQDWIDCDAEQTVPSGLTDFGREVVRELNRLRILIDVSHASEQAIDHVLDETAQPIVASHSNAKGKSPLRRNLTDDHIKRIAETGGVVGVHCSSAFVDIRCLHGRELATRTDVSYKDNQLQLLDDIAAGKVDPFEAEARTLPSVLGYTSLPTVGLDALVDMVDHMVAIAGEDHVGIGTDFEFLEDVVEGFSSADQTPAFLDALERRGYPGRVVDKIAGGNFMRVMAEVID